MTGAFVIPFRRIASLFTLLLLFAVGCGDNDPPPTRSTAKELTAFSFTKAANSALPMDVVATLNNGQIAATVPAGTDVRALIATFTTTGASVKAGGAIQESGVTAHDFSAPVVYTVTAQDGSTKDYTVTVTVAGGAEKDITAFSFTTAANGQLANDVSATINGTQIAATVPSGTVVTALVATFSTTGTSVSVGGTGQVSGTTPNNFTSPVTYRVTAGDGSTQDYTVTVTVAPSDAKAITELKFLSANNGQLASDVAADINGTDIIATVPFGTNLDGLVATFTTTGASVTVNGTAQVSGTTANNFSGAVIYHVIAADNSTADYKVNVYVAPDAAKEITSFKFESAKNSGLTADVVATINGTNITATLPFGTLRTTLVATFATTGTSVSVGGTPQVSGITVNNFTSDVVYRVTASDGSTRDYRAIVTTAPSPAKELTSFAFNSAQNGALTMDVVADITGDNITATVPFGTDRTQLIPTFATTGVFVTAFGAMQTSGVTANDFSVPVTYVVTAADTTTHAYTVTVNVAPNTAKAITSFKFEAVKNSTVLAVDVLATIDEIAHTIKATVPFNTTVTGLVATFATSGQTVLVGAAPQTSAMTPNDFTGDVTYTVVAQNGDMQAYTVTVTVAPGTAKEITDFKFEALKNPGVLSADVDATIDPNAHTITATVPFGTDLTGLIATFATTGTSVDILGTLQASTITPNNFTNPVTYTVTAADTSVQDYVVTVTQEAGSPNKDIETFSFKAADNTGLPADFAGTITGTNIAVVVPTGTALTALVATFTTTGASVTVGGTPQVSGTTPNDFSSMVTYQVHAQDGGTQDYMVTVTTADYCGTVTAPDHGSVVVVTDNGFAPGTATYSCDTGYTLSSTSPVTCTNGTWDPAPTCDQVATPMPTLLLSEVVLTPTGGEFIEIVNPGTAPVELSNYYLSDNGNYFKLPGMVAAGALTIDSSDFIVRFPAATSIPAHGVITVAVDTVANFTGAFPGVTPTYSIGSSTMTVVVANAPTLTNGGEPITLFYWDGQSDLVRDVDLVIVGIPSGATNTLPDKSGYSQDGPDADSTPTAYATDAHTIAPQASAPGAGKSTKRIAGETGETHSGGNGLTGDDETTEDTSMSWDTTATYTAPTPGAAPAALFQ